jgi:hypothetical protein
MGHADVGALVRTRVIIGGVFGLVYVIANTATLASALAAALRAIAIVAFIGLFVAMRRISHWEASPVRRRFGRGFWIVVVGEVSALLLGALVLTGPLNAGDAVIAWVSVVVGVHFIALAAVCHQPFYDTLGVAITICGVAALVAAAAGASTAVISVIGGVTPGFLLLGSAYRPILRRRARSTRS